MKLHIWSLLVIGLIVAIVLTLSLQVAPVLAWLSYTNWPVWRGGW